MRLKGAHLFTTSHPVCSSFLEVEPAVLSTVSSPLPFRLISPTSHLTPYQIPSTIVAAVRVRKASSDTNAGGADILRIAPVPSPATESGRKRKAQMTEGRGLGQKRRPVPIGMDDYPYRVVTPYENEEKGRSATTVAHPSELRRFQSRRRRRQDLNEGDAEKMMQKASKRRVSIIPDNLNGGNFGDEDGSLASVVGEGQYPSMKDEPTRWHEGMHSMNGINYVDAIDAPNASPPPPVVTKTPARWSSLVLTEQDLPTFSSSCGTLASIEYLRYLAVSVGRLPHYPPQLQHNFNIRQREYSERLARVFFVRDGRDITRQPTVGGVRRSGRVRSARDFFMPTIVSNGQRSALNRRYQEPMIASTKRNNLPAKGRNLQNDIDPAELTDVRLGHDYQAELPARIPKTAKSLERSKQLEGTLILSAQSNASLPNFDERETELWREWTTEERAEAIATASSRLTESLGESSSRALGLHEMGAKMAHNLSEEDQERLLEGMMEHGRDFYLLSKEYCKGVSPAHLVTYYYDVWKLRAVPAAKRWYTQRAALAAAEAAEAELLELQRQADAARRAERQEAAARRRQVKEAVQWMRAAGKLPTTINFNKPVVKERAVRTIETLRRYSTNRNISSVQQEKRTEPSSF